MMKKINLFLVQALLVMGLALTVGCSEGDDNSSTTHDVYIAGQIHGPGGIDDAVLWKDGVLQNLTNESHSSYARSVFVSGNDVYVVGKGREGKRYMPATVWKNGIPQYYGDGKSTTYSVFVSGNDVYVAGNSADSATLWKNGVPQNFEESSGAYSVFVSGKDVYVAGYKYNYVGNNTTTVRAVLWKNGVPQNLTNGTTNERANSVFVSGNDVYVAGYSIIIGGDGEKDKMRAILWKNGVPQYLTDGAHFSLAWSVYVSGNDVYVTGCSMGSDNNYYLTLWKNGVPQYLWTVSRLDDYGLFERPEVYYSSVCVLGNDVYVVGRTTGKLWINGEVQDLGFDPYCIFVK